MSSSKKAELTNELNIQFRYVSANSVMFSQAVADKVGLHSTDNECLDFLTLRGSLTPGQIAELTGLTTGAVTAVIDRLEKAGYVRREPSKNDRRKVMVIPNLEKIGTEIAHYVMPMGLALENLCAEFSEEELETVLRFMAGANKFATQEILKLRS